MGTVFVSTYARNLTLHTNTIRDFIERNCMVMGLYSGAVPASADAATTGTLICKITGEGAVVKAKQKIRFTPTTAGTTGTWGINLNNGHIFTFTDDSTPTVSKVCTGLYRLVNTGQGASGKYFTTATDGAITAGGIINIPGIYQKFTLTDNATSLDIEAATAGIGFDYAVAYTGAGNSIATSVITADAYGLKFEAVADVASGTLEKLTTQTWEGTNLVDGVVTHFRIYVDGDDQTVAQGTTNWRYQGNVSTSGSDLNVRSTTFYADEPTQVSNDFAIQWPAS